MVLILNQISENLEKIRTEIKKYSAHPEQVCLVGVTKFQPIEKIKEALSLGLNHLGVNYAQDGEKLMEQLKEAEIQWHFIGHIQSRKAKYLIHYDWVESLDRLEVAAKLNQLAEQKGISLKVLIEINIGRESQKSGILPEDVTRFVEELQHYPFLNLKGFMAMPPAIPVESRRPFFRALKELFDRVSKQKPLEVLSMGTSEDFSVALQEGSNLIRLGSCLFGPRP